MTAASSASSASAASAVTGASWRQPIDPRVGCSTISLRRLPLDEALRKIAGAGFATIDLGALPGVCDHVPFPLPGERVGPIAGLVRDSGLRVRTVNADIGPLDDPVLTPSTVAARLEPLVRLAELTGAPSITLPCGAHVGPAHEGPSQGGPPRGDEDAAIRAVAGALAAAERVVAPAGLALLVEAPHFSRLCHDLPRALRLRDELAGTPVRLVLDTSHVLAGGGDCVAAARAFGDRLAHVHLRDAVRGDIHRSIGRGEVDFAALIRHLTAVGYEGHYSLELETHDVPEAERPAEAARAGAVISRLLAEAGTGTAPAH